MQNKKPIIFISLLVIVFITLGATLAYFTTTDTFNNEFYASEYDVETQESFVSPDNWKPGDTTPKTVVATNHGDIPIAVRVKLTPHWEDKNGDPLPLTDNNDNEVAVIDFSKNYDKKWVYQDGYYYYKRALNKDQSTTSLLKSVTFNMDAEIDNNTECETVDGVTTCRTIFSDYSGGKYTLQVEIETCQYDNYEDIWGTVIEVKDPILVDGTLRQHNNNSSSTMFGKSISRESFESIITVDNKNIPDTAIDSWDCSVEQNESIMCWYVDSDNDDKYELYIGQEDGVKANPDSRNTFAYFKNVEAIDLTNFDTSNVIDMDYMFYQTCYSPTHFEIEGLSDFDTSKVRSMTYLFHSFGYNATIFEMDLSNWETNNVTNMNSMFDHTGYKATTWNIGDLSGWDTSSVTNMGSMFYSSGYNTIVYNIGDLDNWDISNVIKLEWMFASAGYNATTWNIGDLSNWDTSNATTMNHMLSSAGSSATTWNIGDLGGWDTSKVTSMYSMFYKSGFSSSTWSVGNISGWNTSNVTDMSSMFDSAGYNATTFELDLRGWNTSNVTNMDSMFFYAGYNSENINIIGLDGWDTSNVTNMAYMFRGVGYSASTWHIDTVNIYATNIQQLFIGCPNATIILNIYSNPTSYSSAFSNAATKTGSGITVNYSSTTTNIDAIIATKSSNSNVVKGSVLD